MDPLLVVLVGVPLAWLLAMAGYAYVDAGRHGMNQRKWAVVSFFIPLFGFFAYIFERDERRRDPTEEPDMVTSGPFRIHESRADETGIEPGGDGNDSERESERPSKSDEQK